MNERCVLIEEVPEETSEKRESSEGDDKEDSVFSNGVSVCEGCITMP